MGAYVILSSEIRGVDAYRSMGTKRDEYGSIDYSAFGSNLIALLHSAVSLSLHD